MFLRKWMVLGGLIVSLFTVHTYAEAENKLLLKIGNDEENQLEVELPQGWRFDQTMRGMLHIFIDTTQHRISGIGIAKLAKATESSMKIGKIPDILKFFFEPNSTKPVSIYEIAKDCYWKQLTDKSSDRIFYEVRYFFPFQNYRIVLFMRNDIGFQTVYDDVIPFIQSLKVVPKSKPE
jgi:hypothetical protein